MGRFARAEAQDGTVVLSLGEMGHAPLQREVARADALVARHRQVSSVPKPTERWSIVIWLALELTAMASLDQIVGRMNGLSVAWPLGYRGYLSPLLRNEVAPRGAIH